MSQGTRGDASLELSTEHDTLARVDQAAEAREAQTARFREMTPGERWGAARDLYWSMRRLKRGIHTPTASRVVG